jgi:hypothetical protein
MRRPLASGCAIPGNGRVVGRSGGRAVGRSGGRAGRQLGTCGTPAAKLVVSSPEHLMAASLLERQVEQLAEAVGRTPKQQASLATSTTVAQLSRNISWGGKTRGPDICDSNRGFECFA